jgi:hypothetical protein
MIIGKNVNIELAYFFVNGFYLETVVSTFVMLLIYKCKNKKLYAVLFLFNNEVQY